MPDQTMLWPLRVNWGAGWEEVYEFNTDVYRSDDGHEQRRALRADPRAQVRFGSITRAPLRLGALHRLSGRQGDEFIVPHGREWTTLAAPITVGGTAISLTAVPSWWAPGQDLVLGYGDQMPERIRVSGGVLTEPALQSWPAGTRIYRGLRARFAGASQVAFSTNHALAAQSDFLLVTQGGDVVRDGIVTPILPDISGVTPTQFAGRDLFLVRPNWATAVSLAWEQQREVVDFGFGARGFYLKNDFVDRTLKANYLVRAGEGFAEIMHRFLTSRGKQGSFYMPSWGVEFDPIYLTAGAMGIAGTDLHAMIAGDLMHRKVCVRRPNGTFAAAGILSVDTDGTNTILYLDADISGTFTWASWLLRWRFLVDSITVNWLTDGTGEVTLTFFSLEDE